MTNIARRKKGLYFREFSFPCTLVNKGGARCESLPSSCALGLSGRQELRHRRSFDLDEHLGVSQACHAHQHAGRPTTGLRQAAA